MSKALLPPFPSRTVAATPLEKARDLYARGKMSPERLKEVTVREAAKLKARRK